MYLFVLPIYIRMIQICIYICIHTYTSLHVYNDTYTFHIYIQRYTSFYVYEDTYTIMPLSSRP